MADKFIAIIRIRGETGVGKEIKDTLKMLNLNTKFSCAVLPKTPLYQGMALKVKDFATYGDIDEETLKLLNEKRKVEGVKIYRLSPPKGGFERKGTKRTFVEGGALGERKEAINILIKKMV
jgi:large subunit ribosomal protein L30